MSEYLFLYGTLRPADAPEEIRPAVQGLRTVDEGSLPGRLYDLGEYPGAVIDLEAEQRILGTVFELPADAAVLSRMDQYEGFYPGNLGESLFVRVRQRVELESGGSVECWIYEYNQPPLGARVITSGRWRRKDNAAMETD
jgi:pyruvate carboxylase